MKFEEQNQLKSIVSPSCEACNVGISFLDSAEMCPVPESAETQGKSEEYLGLATSQIGLCDDVLGEIICKLPPKDIIRCKLVSKSWKRFISESCIPQVKSTLHGLFVHVSSKTLCRDSAWYFTSMNAEKVYLRKIFSDLLPFTPSSKSFLHCSNGHLLFLDPVIAKFYICNPVTKQRIVIQHHPLILKNAKVLGLNIDETGYNIVFITSNPLEVHAFISGTRTWKLYRSFDLEPDIMSAVWARDLAFIGHFFYLLSLSGHILKFGYKERHVTVIGLPEIATAKKYTGSFGVSQGCLRYAQRVEIWYFMVWELEESNQCCSWGLKHSIYILDLAVFQTRNLWDAKLAIYGFHPYSDVVFFGNAKGICSYYPRDKTFKILYKAVDGTCLRRGPFSLYYYSRNLTTGSLGSITKQEQNGALYSIMDSEHFKHQYRRYEESIEMEYSLFTSTGRVN